MGEGLPVGGVCQGVCVCLPRRGGVSAQEGGCVCPVGVCLGVYVSAQGGCTPPP